MGAKENKKETEPIRIGVYICHCGRNIAGMVDVEAVSEYAGSLPDVAVTRTYKYMCSAPGQELIEEDIRKDNLNRIVVASCSPLLHELTFRNATAIGGLNPFFMHMVSLREHVSWVHEDSEEATKKAKDLVRAAVGRVRFHRPLEKKKVPINPNALIVGGGIAGIHAAITMADSGKKVYLVEREPTIGGHMAQFDKTFPTLDCAACILTPKMMSVGQHPNIELLSYSDVEEVSGYVGNFKIKVRRKARFVDEEKCTSCGDCMENCPVRNRTVIPETPEYPPPEDLNVKVFVDDVLAKYNGNARGSLLPILQEINQEYRYLPRDVIKYVAGQLGIPLSTVLRLATFYRSFSLEPRGQNLISVCCGTACYVRGGAIVAEEFQQQLGVGVGKTTSDMKFTLETVNCLGACALGPVVVVNGKYFGQMRSGKVRGILRKCNETVGVEA